MKNYIQRYKTFFLFFYFLLYISYLANAQPNKDKYRDKIWMFGGYSWRNCSLIFNSGTTDTISYNSRNAISAISSSLCDTLGNLCCYTNGIYIADKTHQKMVNGDSLDYGPYWENYRNLGSAAIQGGVCILPVPNVENSCVMLYPDIEVQPSGVNLRTGLKAAFIDLNRNNGKGVVIQKEIQIFSDSMQAVLATACRHANGRDWWIIGIKAGMGKYYKTLLSRNGLVAQPSQIMPRVIGSDRTSKVAYFSPDGKIYAHYNSGEGTYLYDFDRCTGILSNRRLIPLFRAYRTPFCGIAFSPNSRYLYVTDDSQVAQYDLQALDVPTSSIIVADYDGFQDSLGGNTSFFLLQLAPNGKIYGASTGGNHYLHVIHNPDERGLACNVEQHGLRLPTLYASTMPNFPNFRLGSEPGTVCDSLGIETGVTDTLALNPLNPPKGDFQLSVSPNPTSGECVLSVISSPLGGQRGRIRLLSLDGKVLETFFNPFLNQTNFTINLKNYAKGVYIVEYAADGGGSARARIVRQ